MDAILAGITGFLAQMVDGALGMGYGITSASLLLATGAAPAVVSASVNFAQLGTTLASGASHWRAGNVDRRFVPRLAIPGGIGALTGATVLSALSTSAARPVMSLLLVTLGTVVLIRFLTRRIGAPEGTTPAPRTRVLGPLGLVGGFVSATGGGGWGPVVTSTLLSTGRTAPRTVIGSVSASEFVVTVCASVGFLLGLGLGGFPILLIAALMLGGVLAAPIAARLAGRLPARILGIAVGGLIITLNISPALSALGAGSTLTLVVQAVVSATLLGLLAVAVVRHRRQGGRTHVEVPLEDTVRAEDADGPVPAKA